MLSVCAARHPLRNRTNQLRTCRRTADGIELPVHPTLIPDDRLIANVNGVMNAILVKGDAVGPTLYYGPGAGAEPTASAVVADIVDVARTLSADPKHRVPYLAFQPNALNDSPVLGIDEVMSAYYLGISALDKPGVRSRVATVLSDLGISIEALIQKEPAAGQDHVPVIILTNRTQERQLAAAIAQIEALDSIDGEVVRIRVE